MLFFLLYTPCTKKLCFKGKLRKIKENHGSLVIKEIYEKEGILKTGEFLTFFKTIFFQKLNFLSAKTQLLTNF